MSTPHHPDVATDDLALAATNAFGALLHDKDIASIDVVEGGLLEVLRRGRRERLQVLVEGPLFALLQEQVSGAPAVGPWRRRLPGGALLTASLLIDGRTAVSVRRAAPTDVSLRHLVEEGVVPDGVDAELAAAVWQGQGVVVLGPARAAAQRLAVAVARTVGTQLRIVALGTDVPAGAWPAPAVADIVERARTAAALGADVLFALDVSAADAVRLVDAALPVPLVLSVAVTAVELLHAALKGTPLRALAGIAAVVAWDAEGRARLVELHGEPLGGAEPAGASSSSSSSSSSSAPLSGPTPPPSLTVSAVSAVSAPARQPLAPSPPSSSPTAPLPSFGVDEAPPAEWASEDIDDDPGWELGNLVEGARTSSPPAGSFDAALKAVASRPTFAPRAPAVHPQMATLRGTGGLDLEPPGGPGVDEDRE
jgi:hypothetical protein